MRIVVDLLGCQSTGSRNRGIGRYSMALALAMAKQANPNDFWIALNGQFIDSIASIRKQFGTYLPSDHFFVYDVPNSSGEINSQNLWLIRGSERIREYSLSNLKPDILHVSSLFEGLGDNAITSVGALDLDLSTSVTLYDLIPLIRAETYLQYPQVHSWYYHKIESLKKAELLLAISESSRQEALDFLDIPSEKVITVSTAVDDYFQPITLSLERLQQLKASYTLKRPFIMYTGGIDSRKNIEGLIEAYSKLPSSLRKRYQLAIVCEIQENDEFRLKSLAKQLGLALDDIVLTGFIPDKDLVALYNLCELFVFPSLHEGFGLPALEAMSCGAPTIGSNVSSIPEVIGRCDALFDPNNIESIAQALYKGLVDQEFRQSLREFAPKQASKFSWEVSARRALDAFEHIYKKRLAAQQVQVSFRACRPRLAFISPLPPQQSGIAGYSANLLPILAKYYDVTVIVDSTDTDNPWINKNLAVRSLKWFESHAAEFSRRLYQFGNSYLHSNMFTILEKYPGIVTLHDFYIGGMLNMLAVSNRIPVFFAKVLYQSHGYQALNTLFHDGVETAVDCFPCNQPVLERATGIIVHSEHAKQLANQWYAGSVGHDWQVIPQLSPEVEPIDKVTARANLSLSNDDFLICSFGILGPTKFNFRLLEAWLASKLSKDKNCLLVFVGENHQGDYGEQLISRIQNCNLKNRVKVTGFVATKTYQEYLAAADIAVQLRSLSRGETSRAVLDVLAHQKPLIINAHGTMDDYPKDILVKLPDEFSDQQLTQALEQLYEDVSLRTILRPKRVINMFLSSINSEKVGSLYHEAIEHFTHESASLSVSKVVELISGN
jgi:glycosyltransferase involved in cell wall biosynthesis